MISRQCDAGRHAGGYAPQPAGEGRVVGDAFQPPCNGRAPWTLAAGDTKATGSSPCDCPCHAPGAKLT